ncbi:MAG: hypothetical protein K940chlam7_01194 [Chlamydiae bacterium]|nr:hypothetical protein [Chlamydiota bacterium]
MFCHISQNWRAQPLIDLKTIVELIGNTTTTTGLKIKTKVDPKTYVKGRKMGSNPKKIWQPRSMVNYTTKPSCNYFLNLQ